MKIDKSHLGFYEPGTRVQLARWDFTYVPAGVLVPDEWVTIVYNYATTNGVVGCRYERNNALNERDGQSPVWRS